MARLTLLLLVLSAALTAAANDAPRLLPLALPEEWTLFCPASEEGLDLAALTAIPAELNGAPGRRVRFADHAHSVDRGSSASGPAVFLAEIVSPQDGLMQAGGGADWFWKLQVNGQTVLDLLQQGNQAGPITHRNHRFYLPVHAGRNLVTVLVRRGSNGWKFAFGPVPFAVLDGGILAEPGVAATDCVVPLADGGRATQSEALRSSRPAGRGKDFAISGILAPGLRLGLRSQEGRTSSGGYTIRLAYELDGASAQVAAGAEVQLRIDPAFAAGATVRLDDRELAAADLPERSDGLRQVCIEGDGHRIVCTAESPSLRVRRGGGIEIAAAFAAGQDGTPARAVLQIEAGAPQFRIAAGPEWAPLRMQRTVQAGSILDFSFLAGRHAPAGRLGRLVAGPQGHFTYQATGERARLFGTNLCFDANYVPKDECDALAEVFRRQGYNAVRLHHTDIHLIKGAWNAQGSYDIDPDMLDRLDYLFAAMKRAGMYVTVDFYTMRYFGPGEIPGIDRRISGDIKQLLPVSEDAFRAWSRLVLAWMDHVNPYTGLAWKDDPALAFACPVNEDAVFSVLADTGPAMDLFRQRYQEWKREHGLAGADAAPLKRDPRFARFAIEAERASNLRIAAFLREHGIAMPLSGSNWWNTQAQAFVRAGLDVIDNHQYADHPYNGNFNQSCSIAGDGARITPLFMAPTRIFGRPFVVTEFNYCFPNRYRAEGGALFGACSALQDWDAAFRFSWSHGRDRNLAVVPISHFDTASDLLSLHADRQVALLFARGDVAPGVRSYVYAVGWDEACRDGFGGMWSGGLFPAGFSALGLVSRVGSQALEDGAVVGGGHAGVCSATPLPDGRLGGNAILASADLARLTAPDAAGEIVSDTGEIRLAPQAGRLRIITPRTECLVSGPAAALAGDRLALQGLDGFASVSASAMDGRTLGESSRILVLHLTNVLNSGMRFSNPEMRRIEETGVLPHLVRRGAASIALRSAVPGLQVFAIAADGGRLCTVPSTYTDGIYRFEARIAADPEPVLAYELAP